MNKKIRNSIIAFLVALTLIFGGAYTYLSDSYSPEEAAINALNSTEEVQIEDMEEYTAFTPKNENSKTGFIFYQGGKVEADAYAPLMRQIAEEGIASYIVEMPFNLAVFDSDAADTVIDKEREIKEWYVGGHSLGGAMASSYAEKHSNLLEGLVLLAAYSSVDLSKKDLSVLSIYGNEDQVLDKEKYKENLSFLPQLEELVIDGGNHAYFGNYGEQKGDGEATISSSEQVEESAKAIVEFIKK